MLTNALSDSKTVVKKSHRQILSNLRCKKHCSYEHLTEHLGRNLSWGAPRGAQDCTKDVFILINLHL